ncbi:hypothetical protein like AT3G10300 [Hibiscus trionum]|uniref:EF-hand domain-containing protein n=1 Tax=Hibiscus trionum TaxID=183268 RepID=A0A9W7IWR9_HIBTR|nr:hypothetical protein like AT3G10300 [Hibiscus trionum]
MSDEQPQHSSDYGPPPAGCYPSPFPTLYPSTFSPDTNPNIVACFQLADQDESGFIDDKGLQRALSSINESFSMRTIHMLMYLFTSNYTRKIGPKEFTSLFNSLQSLRAIFEKFDRDRTGKIGENELNEALLSQGLVVSPTVLELLVTKFDKTLGSIMSVDYENFILCCLIVKGLTEKFKEHDNMHTGSAKFTYGEFLFNVLPFLVT